MAVAQAGADASAIFSLIAPPHVFEVLVPDPVSALRAVVHCFTNGSFKVETEGAMRALSYTKERKLVLLAANFNLSESEAATALQRGVVYKARNQPHPNRRISVLGYVSIASVLQAEAGLDDDNFGEVVMFIDGWSGSISICIIVNFVL